MSVARHTAYNLAGTILPLGVTLVTIPLYLEAIGLDRYGVLALAWVLAGYFNFFDFGIGRATARKMATLNHGEPDERSRLFWTSAGLTAALAVLATVVFWPIAHFVLGRMEVSVELRPELVEAMPLLVAAVPLGIVQSLLTGALEGRRAFGPLNSIQLAGTVLTAILPLLAAWTFGPGLALLMAAMLASRMIILAAQLAACRRLIPLIGPQLSNRNGVTELLKFGGWATISGIVGPILVYFDRFAIGAALGAAAVGFYVIGYNLIAQLQRVPAALARALFPRLAELSEDESAARSIDGLQVMTALVTPITIVAIFVITPFLSLWVGAKISTVTGPVAVILLVGFWSNALAFVAFARLHAIGRPDATARAHLSELLPYGAALYACMYLWGLPGAAVAWSARCTVDLIALALIAKLHREIFALFSVGLTMVLVAAVGALGIESALLYWPLAVLGSVIASLWSWMNLPTHLRARALDELRHLSKFLRVHQ